MKTWPADDIGRSAAGPETIPVPTPAEACTDIGQDEPGADTALEMLGSLLILAVGLVSVIALFFIFR